MAGLWDPGAALWEPRIKDIKKQATIASHAKCLVAGILHLLLCTHNAFLKSHWIWMSENHVLGLMLWIWGRLVYTQGEGKKKWISNSGSLRHCLSHSVSWRENIESGISPFFALVPMVPRRGCWSPQFLNLNSGTHQSPGAGGLHCCPSVEIGTTQTNPSKQIGMTWAIRETEWCKKQQLGMVLFEIRWSGSVCRGIQPPCWQFSAHKW